MISALPCGYDSRIGHHGYQLSGGERQRLGLARALLAKTPVLIIDEGTSALDGVTALQLHENLRAHFRGRSLVIIAHHLPRMEPLDQVIVLDHGRISEQGAHGQLRDRGGPYAQLLRTQSAHSKLTNTHRKVQL
jgi:ABC-type multidrug transport system fused ATPase/permease subunit